MKFLKIPSLITTAVLTCTAYSQADIVFSYNFNGDPSSTSATNGGLYGPSANYYANPTPSTQGSTPGVSGLAGDYAFNAPVSASGSSVGFSQTGSYWPAATESFTFSFWLKPNTTQVASARIVDTSPGAPLYLQWNGQFGVDNNYTASNPGWLQDDVTAQSMWTFYAITYDGTLSSNNVKYYRGTAADAATLITTLSLNAGAMNPVQSGTFNATFANNGLTSTTTGARPYFGSMDNVSLSGVSSGSSGALDLAGINAIRAAAVPEPSAIALLGLVGLSAIVYRAKRRVSMR